MPVPLATCNVGATKFQGVVYTSRKLQHLPWPQVVKPNEFLRQENNLLFVFNDEGKDLVFLNKKFMTKHFLFVFCSG